MKCNYETIADNGSKYSFEIKDNKTIVYVNDELWGEPQGSRFMTALIRDILNLKRGLQNTTRDSVKNKYDVVFRALQLACEELKVANIEISNSSDFEFLNNKIHGTLVGYYLMKAESEIKKSVGEE